MVGAVIYVRVSTKEQTENLSLPTQLRACEEYCRRPYAPRCNRLASRCAPRQSRSTTPPTFLAPLGYLNAPRAMGKSLIPDPERAPIVRRVFEKYAIECSPFCLVACRSRRRRSVHTRTFRSARSCAASLAAVDSPAAGQRAKRLIRRNAASRRRGPSRISGTARSGWRSSHSRTQRRREGARVAEMRCADSGS